MSFRVLIIDDWWSVLRKLSLMAYLCHYIVIFCFYASSYNSHLLSQGIFFRVSAGSLFLSYIFGMIMYLLIDKPMRNIDHLVLFPTKIKDSFLIKKNPHKIKKFSHLSSNAMEFSLNEKSSMFSKSGVLQEVVEEESEAGGSDESEDENTATVKRTNLRDKSSVYFKERPS